MKLGLIGLIICLFVSLILYWVVIQYGSSLLVIDKRMGFTNYNYNADEYNNSSPLYSHTVNLPINDPVSCSNFCGPKATCSKTGEQCTSDVDCFGCQPLPKKENTCLTKYVPAHEENIFSQKLSLKPIKPMVTSFKGYDSLDNDYEEAYAGSKQSQITPYYKGEDLWTNSFNEGLNFYNKKREANDRFSEGISSDLKDLSTSKLPFYTMQYPTTISSTGQFYQTLAPPSNADL